ncbi:hypothetical protein F5X68DRAFT_137989, partial [Plectosphaerella plurivora]
LPQLVGSGTAVAAAALSLVFAHPDELANSSPASSTRARANTTDEYQRHPRLSSAPVTSRPVTRAAGSSPSTDRSRPPSAHQPYGLSVGIVPRQRPASAQVTPPKTLSRRQSAVRQGDFASQPIAENQRDSVSSNSSWIRRLSLRPLSQHGSLRSSAGPADNHSIAFSHGSSAPILPSDGIVVPPLPPNKLVKRAPSAHQNGAATRRRAKSHLPTLRRPATNEQSRPKYSFDLLSSQDIISSRPIARPTSPSRPRDPARWTSLFHFRRVAVSVRGAPDRFLDRGASQLQKRIRVPTDTARDQHRPDTDLAPSQQGLSRHRNSSSPLPPLSRLSSFNVDLSKLGAAAPGHLPRPNQPSGSSQSSVGMASFRNPRHERSSTLNSSDMEVRGFHSGEDEDTDFKSDTMFDSIRTAASGRVRAAESPVESMFDESPPSTAGNGKTKRLSIQEILGHAWEADNRIMEEDENTQTPVRGKDTRIFIDHAEVELRINRERTSDDYSTSQKEARMSFDDDFDDDWARDHNEEDLAWGNRLSPPSSMNSRGVSPNLRFALATANGTDISELTRDLSGERPRSNIFDWTEPSPEKADADGSSVRPKTVHGKQEMDLRGGRTSNRKGAAMAHIRSQSVPVVYDPTDSTKVSTQKYGTWGLGTKGASEDWDDDFEFDGGEADQDADKSGLKFDMVVPASIQASQPSLKQHSGQIRELSLLVNDLKRLCRHGRDLNMLNGPQASLWKEADGIIALASPDEDELEGMDVDSSDIEFEPSTLSDRTSDEVFDSGPLKNLEAAFEPHDLRMAKTTVIRERPAGRRRSVFSPDDDIFGGNKLATAESSAAPSRPKTPENNINMGGHDVTDIVKSVLDAMQRRSTSESTRGSKSSDSKLHFGTHNLKALVKRAGDLRDALSEEIRRVDQITQSPARTPRRSERESPAFTRVFTPEAPPSSPPKRLPHSHSNSSALSRGSHEASPSSGMSRRMQMMTVS